MMMKTTMWLSSHISPDPINSPLCHILLKAFPQVEASDSMTMKDHQWILLATTTTKRTSTPMKASAEEEETQERTEAWEEEVLSEAEAPTKEEVSLAKDLTSTQDQISIPPSAEDSPSQTFITSLKKRPLTTCTAKRTAPLRDLICKVTTHNKETRAEGWGEAEVTFLEEVEVNFLEEVEVIFLDEAEVAFLEEASSLTTGMVWVDPGEMTAWWAIAKNDRLGTEFKEAWAEEEPAEDPLSTLEPDPNPSPLKETSTMSLKINNSTLKNDQKPIDKSLKCHPLMRMNNNKKCNWEDKSLNNTSTKKRIMPHNCNLTLMS